MTTLIEDSPRSFQAQWIGDAFLTGSAEGAVLTPWATPWHHRGGPGKKPGIRERSAQLREMGIPVWFDATTHALQMGGVGDFRYYDEFDLWDGARGALHSNVERDSHIRKVFGIQDELQAARLAPTILLHTGLSQTSVAALDMARRAISTDPSSWMTVAGTNPFWSSGGDLDAHIGALAALKPQGWFLAVARPVNEIPAPATREEVFGLCRTVRALSESAPVHVSHGDFAGLPAVAAGATSVGTGWDKRQRVLSYSDYAARMNGGSGGAWYERPSYRGLLGSLSTTEAQVLRSRAEAFEASLGGAPAPGPKEAFLRHAEVLSASVERVRAAGGYQERWMHLRAEYRAAATNWGISDGINPTDFSAGAWITPLDEGLRAFGQSEGWI